MMQLYRSRFLEVAFSKRPLALQVYNSYDDHDTLMISLFGLSAFITLPKFLSYEECFEGGFGFMFTDETLHIAYGKKTKVLWYPWCNWDMVRHELMLTGGKFVPAPKWNKFKKEDDPVGLFKETRPYHYILKSGAIQTVQATYGVEEREWRLKWFKWLPIKKVKRCIDVNFSEEVGEERGSWKGGCLGTGHEMRMRDKKYKTYEQPWQTLQRMMRERYFER